MDISKDNYEIWLLDFLEGNLDPAGEETVMKFLESNPELKEELEMMRSLFLEPGDSIHYSGTNSLKKEYVAVGSITPGNLDELLIGKLEGDIDPKTTGELEEFLQLNPDYREDWKRITLTRLAPDPGIVFPSPDSLKKKGIILLLLKSRMAVGISAAAMIIIILGIRFFPGTTEGPVHSDRPDNHPIAMMAAKSGTGITVALNNSRATIESRPLKESPGRFSPRETLVPLSPAGTIAANEVDLYNSLPGYEMASLLPPLTKPGTDDSGTADKGSLLGRIIKKMVVPITNIAEQRQSRKTSEQPLDFWKIAEVGVKGYNLMADKEVELVTEKNEQGKVTNYLLVENDRTLFFRDKSTGE